MSRKTCRNALQQSSYYQTTFGTLLTANGYHNDYYARKRKKEVVKNWKSSIHNNYTHLDDTSSNGCPNSNHKRLQCLPEHYWYNGLKWTITTVCRGDENEPLLTKLDNSVALADTACFRRHPVRLFSSQPAYRQFHGDSKAPNGRNTTHLSFTWH